MWVVSAKIREEIHKLAELEEYKNADKYVKEILKDGFVRLEYEMKNTSRFYPIHMVKFLTIKEEQEKEND